MFSSKSFLLIGRELKARVTNKIFVIATILTPALMAVFLILPGWLATRKKDVTSVYSIVDASGLGLREAIEKALAHDKLKDGSPRFQFDAAEWDESIAPPPSLADQNKDTKRPKDAKPGDTSYMKVTVAWDPVDDALRKAVLEGGQKGYLVFPPNFADDGYFHVYTRTASDFVEGRALANAATEALRKHRGTTAGIAEADLRKLLASARSDERSLERMAAEKAAGGEASAEAASSRESFSTAFTVIFLLYFTLILYSVSVTNDVVEDKQTRVTEVLLASSGPGDLLVGKLIGVGLAGMLQYAIWIGLYLILTSLKPSWVGEAAAGVTAGQAIGISVGFAFGVLVFGSLGAMLGSMCSTNQEASQMQWITSMMLFASLMGFFAIFREPDGAAGTVLTLLPLTSPLIVPARLMMGPIDPGVLLGAAALGLVAIAVLLWLGARVYRATILLYGKRPSFGEVIRLVFTSGG